MIGASVGDCLAEGVAERGRVLVASGEEFVIAGVAPHPDPHAMAQRLREAMADLPVPVTASIGTASIALVDAYPRNDDRVITELIDAADQAMYAAKRAAGDRVDDYRVSNLNPVPDR